MRDWADRQVSLGALVSIGLCAVGVGLIVAAIVGLLDDPWASLGVVFFMAGGGRMIVATMRSQQQQIRDVFELGREAAKLKLHVTR